MCLAIPGLVVEVDGNVAVADFWGARKRVRLDIVDAEVRPGDYILTHVGFAIKRVSAQEAEETLRLFDAFIGGLQEGGK
ncbi:MAG: HypC/HybG/HupF family hydrogenase formation chaperone [Thermoplasmata archaeon]